MTLVLPTPADHGYDYLNWGAQDSAGTAVAADFRLPLKADGFDPDRSYRNPEEDLGTGWDSSVFRGRWGMKAPTIHVAGEAGFEFLPHLLAAHLGHSGTPITVEGTPTLYDWVFTAGTIGTVAEIGLPNFATVEHGSNSEYDQWRLIGAHIPDLTLGFDALVAPGNSPWTVDATVNGLDFDRQAPTAGLDIPATEVVEGYSTVADNSMAASVPVSLPFTPSNPYALVSFKLASPQAWTRRPYGGDGDTASTVGHGQRPGATVELSIAVADDPGEGAVSQFIADAGQGEDTALTVVCHGASGQAVVFAPYAYRLTKAPQRGERENEVVWALSLAIVGGYQVQVRTTTSSLSTLGS